MIPKSYKQILKKVIEEKGYDESFAEDAVSFYWSEIRKYLSDLKGINIKVNNLGTFNIKPWRVDEFIETYGKHLKKTKGVTFAEAKYRKQMEEQYNVFLRLKGFLEEEEKKKQNKKEEKKEYELAKNMDKQETDPGGNKE